MLTIKIRSYFKYLLSFLKRDWDLADYPVIVRYQDPEKHPPPAGIGQVEPIPWFASIDKWFQMFAPGETREEALENLRQNFGTYKAKHATLPRPGTLVELEMALTQQVDRFADLAHDFISKIVEGVNPNFVFISDSSSLWDFPYEDKAKQIARIKEIYGVDVSDIQDGNLAKIFDRIRKHQSD